MKLGVLPLDPRAAHAISGRGRIATLVSTLEGLVGAHLDTLAEMFLRGVSVDPDDLGALPRGRLLAIAGTEPAHLALRPLVKAVSAAFSLWDGVVFDHGGVAGANRFRGREALRFRAQRGASLLDAGPTLVLTYDDAPWPFRGMRDELRLIAPGLAIGPTYIGDSLVAWFGFQAEG